MLRLPSSSTLFPYTTLFRSEDITGKRAVLADVRAEQQAIVREAELADRRLKALEADKAASHQRQDRKSTRLNSSHMSISYAVFCLKKKIKAKNGDCWSALVM